MGHNQSKSTADRTTFISVFQCCKVVLPTFLETPLYITVLVLSVHCQTSKTRPNHPPSSTVLDSWFEMLMLIGWVWFSLQMALSPNLPSFVSSVQKSLFHRSFGAITCNFANLSYAAISY